MKKPQHREYGNTPLLEQDISPNPITQFNTWYQAAINAELIDANAMVLSTVDDQNYPDSRVVLLKDFSAQGFVFFTNYSSSKAMQLAHNQVAALNFYWREFTKQIRIRGKVTRIAPQESQKYFMSRPRESQICALASHQSHVVPNRTALENSVAELTKQYEGKTIPCPNDWGGYSLAPFEFEFFQGRDNRLNDRIRYRLVNSKWIIERLAP